MAKGIIGQATTFTVLFLDSYNQATNVTSPTIEVFYFDDNGDRIYIVPIGTPLPASVPAQTGRYSYTTVIPGSLDVRYQLFGIMQGIDPVTSHPIVVEQQVDLFTDQGSVQCDTGLRASFVKNGIC